MTKKHIKKAAVAGTALLIVFGFVFSGAAYGETTSMADVKKELAEAMDAIKAYSVERKDDAFKAMEQTLNQMDQQIDLLGEKIKKEWAQMEPEARKKAEKTMDQLRQQRDRLAESINKWKENNAPSWNKIKDEFMKSYEEFKKSLENADQENDRPITNI